jgi:hypothetical protein
MFFAGTSSCSHSSSPVSETRVAARRSGPGSLIRGLPLSAWRRRARLVTLIGAGNASRVLGTSEVSSAARASHGMTPAGGIVFEASTVHNPPCRRGRRTAGSRGLGLGRGIPSASPLIFLQSEFGREDLQRDIATELRVPRALNLPHAAGAKRGQDLVRTEARAVERKRSPKAPNDRAFVSRRPGSLWVASAAGGSPLRRGRIR